MRQFYCSDEIRIALRTEPVEILGHGIDLVNLRHVETLLSIDVNVPHDWLTDKELAFLPEEHEHQLAFYAGRIAAKEAVVKAMGTGFAGDITWSDVEVLSNADGSPSIQLYGALLALASARGVNRCLISISHTSDQALASVFVVTS